MSDSRIDLSTLEFIEVDGDKCVIRARLRDGGRTVRLATIHVELTSSLLEEVFGSQLVARATLLRIYKLPDEVRGTFLQALTELER